MKEYYTKSINIEKIIELRIRDTILCSDGCSMVVKADIKIKRLENGNPYRDPDTGLFNFSITRIKTDNKGVPKLYSKIDKETAIDSKDIEFKDNGGIIFKKEIFDEETNMKYCFDIQMEQLLRRLSKNISEDTDNERKVEEENETITSFLIVKGQINEQVFSNKAEGRLTINYSKQEISHKGNILLYD